MWCRPSRLQSSLDQLSAVGCDKLQGLVGADERFHRFREVSGVPAIEAALTELNERLIARGVAHLARRTPLTVTQSSHLCNTMYYTS